MLGSDLLQTQISGVPRAFSSDLQVVKSNGTAVDVISHKR